MTDTAALTKGTRDRELMLRTIDNILRADYAIPGSHDRYSSIETHRSAIYNTMDSSRWERNFVHATRAYLAEYRDPNLQLVVPDRLRDAEAGAGFSVRRRNDSLYVESLWGETRLAPGDRIVRVGSRPVADCRAVARFWLPAGDAEHEDWDLVLDGAPSVTLASGETLVLEAHPRPAPAPARWETAEAGVGFVRLERLEALDLPSGLRGLILDLRSCTGQDPAALEALLPLVVKEPAKLGDLLGTAWYTSYTDRTCRRIAAALRLAAEAGSQLDAAVAQVEALAGAGPVLEDDRADYGEATVRPLGTFPVAVLTDRRTCGDAELLARVARESGRCAVVGRETRGGTHTGTLCAADLGDGYSLLYPASATVEAFEQPEACLGRGVSPTVTVAWTPEHCTCDIDRAVAQEALKKAMG